MTPLPRLRRRLHGRERRPVFSLLTDFGLGDGFVGQVKAVILSIVPDAQIIDLGHDIPAQDVQAGALLLETAYRYFPPGTIHVCVVDPGVGSERRAVVLRTRSALFVAPDNGLLSPILMECPEAEARSIKHPLLSRVSPSATFHGRDLFAVAAARLGNGFPFERVGLPVSDPVRLSAIVPAFSNGMLKGQIVTVDHFGNAAANITTRHLQGLSRPLTVFSEGVCYGPLRRYYAEAPPGDPLAILNSAGRLELAVNCGRAVDLGAKVGAGVEVHAGE